ncbi:hypothetical protein DDI_2905 [Dickeya dianthicola RNS04.9]|nr:hypothetical protein DDI_2905 [Dickeya dianthicola RNS04.9]
METPDRQHDTRKNMPLRPSSTSNTGYDRLMLPVTLQAASALAARPHPGH